MQDYQLNTLVVSDLHLGEDLTPCAMEATSRHIDQVERQLVAFLRYYARRRDGGRPWRLVIAGDMIDFLAVYLAVDDPRVGEGLPHSEEERTYGFARRRDVSAIKMALVAERHPEFFRALARFAARGNRVEIICGNHDAELYWPEVQVAFREAVAAAWRDTAESTRPGAPDAETVSGAIGFHPWFFYEPGVAWIEHGHQYDETCSFEYGLYPVRGAREELVTNADTAVTRYITNKVEEADPHSHDAWSFRGYLSFGIGLGVRGTLRLVRAYHKFATVLLRTWKRHAKPSSENRRRRDRHDERLRELAAAWALPEETLRAMAGFHRRPIIRDLSRLSRLVMLDTMIIAIGGIALAALAALVLAAPLSFAAVAMIGLSAWGAARWSSRYRSMDPSVPLQVLPERMLRYVDARYVVFGHTHRPVAQPLTDGNWYFNTGTWVPSGKPGLLRVFTHLVIRHTEAGPRAELCQWRDGASRAFSPSRQLAGAEAPQLAPAEVEIGIAGAEA
jgi:UDP-2,3-diacylglucosamine pyrophosphatase LpxH